MPSNAMGDGETRENDDTLEPLDGVAGVAGCNVICGGALRGPDCK